MKQLMPERMALKRERWLRGSMGKGNNPDMKVIEELKQGKWQDGLRVLMAHTGVYCMGSILSRAVMVLSLMVVGTEEFCVFHLSINDLT